MLLFQPPLRGGRLRQGEHRIDHRRDLAFIDQAGDIGELAAVGLDLQHHRSHSARRCLLLRWFCGCRDKDASGLERTKRAILGFAADEIEHQIKVVSRSEEHTSELQSLMRISYAVFCLNKKNKLIKI